MTDIHENYDDEFDYESQDEETGCGVYCVSTFLVDRAYGGPEEGGWYYEVGQPVLEPNLPIPRFTIDQEEARKWAAEMRVELDENFNKYRRSISSVLSEGRYDAVVSEGWPKPYPSQRPHYE